MNNYIDEQLVGQLGARAAPLPDLPLLLQAADSKFQTALSRETPASILQFVRRINAREGKRESGQAREGPAESWSFGERKVFCWVVVLHLALGQLGLQSMELSHIHNIHAIFPRKSLEFLRYELTALARAGNRTKEAWSEEELKTLSGLVTAAGERVDWRAVSFGLFVALGGSSFKPLQECREKWCNYLNPQLRRQRWSLEEDYELFELVEREGTRWALISREFKLNRTEHMVKNRYNAYLKTWRNKRTNVKSTKGLINRILSYLRGRINKKFKPTPHPHPQPLPDQPHQDQQEEDIDEYASQEPNSLPLIQEPGYAREAYEEEKKEKRTLDCEDEVVPVREGSERRLEGVSLELLMAPLEPVEMRLIEDDVLRFLVPGMTHFEHALEPYQSDSFQECDSFSWLI